MYRTVLWTLWERVKTPHMPMEQGAKLEKEIARLEKLARAEKQPKKKFEWVQQITNLKKILEE